jgi:hypothetical protein
LPNNSDIDWIDIYYDLNADPEVQESQFIALRNDEVDKERHFPLKTLFDSVSYRSSTEGRSKEVIKRIDDMQAIFKEMKVPVQISKTQDKATVAIIFERVNRQGVPLDTLQLLSAWTWSEEFQLQEQFTDLADELQPFGFAEVGSDTNLLLRCCSAILASDASPKSLMELNGGNVRRNFDRVTNGVKYAVDYLKQHFKVEKLNNLPFTTLLVPLAVFFAVAGSQEKSTTAEQSKLIDRWFWRSCFSRRYSSGVLRNLNTDIEQMMKLRDGEASILGDFPTVVGADFFLTDLFNLGNVNSKTFLLLLARNSPLSFISKKPIDSAATLKAANRSEFHHMMPREFLRKSAQNVYADSILANICFLSRADNRALGGVAPSIYRAKMPKNDTDIEAIMTAAISNSQLFSDNYSVFAKLRAAELAKIANKLCVS